MVLLLRTAHYNLAKLRDVYLHTNTLAALANLAPHAQDLSSHAAQRLVSLFDMLARRYCTPQVPDCKRGVCRSTLLASGWLWSNNSICWTCTARSCWLQTSALEKR